MLQTDTSYTRKSNLVTLNSEFDYDIKLDLKLSMSLEPIRVFSITTIIRADARFHIPNITANKNTIPNDPRSPFVTSGLRIGTPAVTTRGFKENEMILIADWITDAINDFDNNKERINKEVLDLCAQFPVY